MKKYNNTQNNSLWTKVMALLTVFVFSVANVFATPSVASTNLQTTAGVTVTANGNALTFTTPDKAILTWQAFGSGTDTIGVNDSLNYVLPTKNSSVLNIVAGGSNTTIDGSILSNGNVYVLNPNGIVLGNGARIDVNSLYVGTSDNLAFASYYFGQNGKLPSQNGLAPLAGSAGVSAGAIIRVTDNITIAAKNITVGGAVVQGNLVLSADGNLSVGSAALTYVDGALSISNTSGATVLGSTGNNLIVTGNLTATGGTTSAFSTVGTAGSIQVRSANITSGAINADKINTNALTLDGTNVTVNVGNVTTNPVVSVTGNGTIAVTAPAALTANVANKNATATTSVTAGGALTLNSVQVEGTGLASFTGTTVTDTTSRLFVYGPVAFNATTGNVTINKGNHSFGPVSVSATNGEAIVVEDAATQLNVISTPKLALTSRDYVFQTPTTGVIGSANTVVSATGNITLGAAANAAGSYSLVGKDITLATAGATSLAARGGNVAVTSTGLVTLGNVNADGTLGVNTTMPITQATDTKVSAVGAVSLVGSALTLNNVGNTFGALTIDVGATGNAAVTEETTLNLASLRAASATFNSNGGVITSGVLPVVADTFNIVAGGDFVPAANFRAVNPITVLSGGTADLSALSLATNLNSKSPSIIAKGYKAPQP
jgi:filamentous hemagglutinin family protein